MRWMLGIGALFLCACVGAVSGRAEEMAQLKARYVRPAEIPFPADNPYTLEKAALGKALFFEPRLSGAENMTCASCHNPSFGWEAPNQTSVGALNTRLARRAPTILNLAWVSPLFWDGRATSAEVQATGPIEAPAEMNLPITLAVSRLKHIPEYKSWFERVFPGRGVSAQTIAEAVATYERTVVASYAPFDAWIDGDERAISEAAKRGFVLFNGRAACADCHTGWNFTDNKFHDIGTTTTDLGRGAFEPDNAQAQYAFKTPTLRDTAQRAPYMHAGQLASLDDVMLHYQTGGISRPSRSPLMRPLQLTDDDISDVIAFLKTLTGAKTVVAMPVLPN